MFVTGNTLQRMMGRVDPVEINAGAWYLRTLRADDWASDAAYSWAVCEPTTGQPLAELVLDPVAATLRVHAVDGHADAAEAGAQAVRRFAAVALNLTLRD
jgi:hypothetical protein